jgi:hypothetical protein
LLRANAIVSRTLAGSNVSSGQRLVLMNKKRLPHASSANRFLGLLDF